MMRSSHDISRSLLAGVAAAALVGGALPTLASTFGAPVPLSVNGHANDASAGIDDAGNATAVWADGAAYYADKPNGGSWSAPGTFFAGQGAGFISMHKSALGADTTIAWGSTYGIYSIDRPAGGAWGAPVLLVSAPDLVTPLYDNAPAVIFKENAAGDQAVIFQQYSGGATLISALRRPNGGLWSAPEIVASSTTYGDLELAGAGIGAGGDVSVTWQTFTSSCSRSCHSYNYAVHTSREATPGVGWSDSGALTPQGAVWWALPVSDPAGGAATLAQPSFGTTVSAYDQRKVGGRWSAPATAFTGPGGSIADIFGAEASSLGRVSLLTGAGGIWDVDGQIGANTWGAPVNLAAADTTAAALEIAYGASEKGGLAVNWVDGDGTVRVATRASALASWAPTVTIAPAAPCNIGGVVCNGPAAAAINSHGKAVVLYVNINSSVTVYTLYATTN